MCKKVALVGFFQVQNHYNKLFDKKFNTHIKDNSCDNNTSKSEIFFSCVCSVEKIFCYFRASEEKILYLYRVNDILE